MSMTFFVADPDRPQVYDSDTDGFYDEHLAVLNVDDPGSGTLTLCLVRDGQRDTHRCEYADRRLRGRDLGVVSDALLDLVTGVTTDLPADAGRRLGGPLTRRQARLLLRPFLHAVLVATAGSNVYEVVQDDDRADFTWCTTCGEGAIYATQECRIPQLPQASCARTDWCDQHGHTPFAGRTMPAASVAS